MDLQVLQKRFPIQNTNADEFLRELTWLEEQLLPRIGSGRDEIFGNDVVEDVVSYVCGKVADGSDAMFTGENQQAFRKELLNRTGLVADVNKLAPVDASDALLSLMYASTILPDDSLKKLIHFGTGACTIPDLFSQEEIDTLELKFGSIFVDDQGKVSQADRFFRNNFGGRNSQWNILTNYLLAAPETVVPETVDPQTVVPKRSFGKYAGIAGAALLVAAAGWLGYGAIRSHLDLDQETRTELATAQSQLALARKQNDIYAKRTQEDAALIKALNETVVAKDKTLGEYWDRIELAEGYCPSRIVAEVEKGDSEGLVAVIEECYVMNQPQGTMAIPYANDRDSTLRGLRRVLGLGESDEQLFVDLLTKEDFYKNALRAGVTGEVIPVVVLKTSLKPETPTP